MSHYFKNKREKIGKCNICMKESKLTWDHIPPKGGIELTAVEQVNIMQHMTDHSNEKYLLSQNGVKYRTICSSCNNSLLGLKYDPILNSFSNELSLFLKTTITLPSKITFKTKPAMIAKAIIGHLLAAKGEFENTKLDERYREFFLDDTIVIPKELKIFYWVYPYLSVKIIRDVGMPKVRGNFNEGIGMFSIFKFFPIAYIVTDVEDYEGLDELTQYCSNTLQSECELPIRLNNIKEENWPEIGDDNFLMGGQSLQSGVSAIPRRKR